MTNDVKPISRQNDLVVQELASEILIYDLRADRAVCLNETSALVYNLCDGTKTPAEIRGSIEQKLKSNVPEELIWLALYQLKKEDLLANGKEIVPKFNGMSRRRVIKKIGLACAVALPLITGLVAPTAAQAQSTCTTSNDCPSPSTLCQIATCVYGNCGFENIPARICVDVGVSCDGAGVEIFDSACITS